MWFDFVIFVLSIACLTFIVTDSNIFKPLREAISKRNSKYNSIEVKKRFIHIIDSLINCYFCTSIWVGFLVSYIMYVKELDWLMYPFAGAMMAKVIYKLQK